MVVVLTDIVAKVVVPAMLTWLGVEGAKWLKARTGNENLAAALTRLTDTVNTVVAEVQQTIVTELRKKTADGHLSAQEIAEIKAAALERIRKYLGPDGVQILGQYLKLDQNGVISFIGAKIEAAVLAMKTPVVAPTLLPVFGGMTEAEKAAAKSKR